MEKYIRRNITTLEARGQGQGKGGRDAACRNLGLGTEVGGQRSEVGGRGMMVGGYIQGPGARRDGKRLQLGNDQYYSYSKFPRDETGRVVQRN